MVFDLLVFIGVDKRAFLIGEGSPSFQTLCSIRFHFFMKSCAKKSILFSYFSQKRFNKTSQKILFSYKSRWTEKHHEGHDVFRPTKTPCEQAWKFFENFRICVGKVLIFV